LKYLDGGHGQGCNEADDRWTLERRACHHFTFYGFALCFAATATATVYHYALGWVAPYAWLSLPKLLGMTGGLHCWCWARPACCGCACCATRSMRWRRSGRWTWASWPCCC
jgi:hypothetical protein